MPRALTRVLAWLVLLLAAPLLLAQGDDAALLARVGEALWPADIVRAAEAYLRAHPQGASAAAVESERQRAVQTAGLIGSNEVRLFRSTFSAPAGDTEARAELRRAALGDRAAALRLARAAGHSAEGTPERQRWVGWMQLAALQGDAATAYELALYFRRTDQPAPAARYEALALSLGYEPARALDNVRK